MNQVIEASGTESWQGWVGRQETVSELLSAEKVAGLAATLDIGMSPAAGDMLPPGWHWLFFNPFVPRSALGVDGHPRRGGFLPPVPLPRRMWAGGRVFYSQPLTIGKIATRTSTISKVEAKSGRAGHLVFVTVVHRTTCCDVECIVEEQDIVYREAAAPGAPAPALTPAPAGAQWRTVVEPDPVLLFRYSALTSNGHRIHYDGDYARREENYPALVVHGPLTATLLQNFASELRPDADLTRFEFRGVHPLFVNASFTLEAKLSENPDEALELWAKGPRDELAMRATAFFSR
ncbi:FAS1-like dehydratase domain-containing protein [Azorhizobium doebereinerae]|uniref:FAS1-like dehydratase domain-containing protein n=1 Tax=Azorhizobium doebereinerae TaxID=281091 RepID=UPI000413231A|nr:MaoC family dehydratase N-terminal domain-containing protein [Azorhizobium doebereinerae]